MNDQERLQFWGLKARDVPPWPPEAEIYCTSCRRMVAGRPRLVGGGQPILADSHFRLDLTYGKERVLCGGSLVLGGREQFGTEDPKAAFHTDPVDRLTGATQGW